MPYNQNTWLGWTRYCKLPNISPPSLSTIIEYMPDLKNTVTMAFGAVGATLNFVPGWRSSSLRVTQVAWWSLCFEHMIAGYNIRDGIQLYIKDKEFKEMIPVIQNDTVALRAYATASPCIQENEKNKLLEYCNEMDKIIRASQEVNSLNSRKLIYDLVMLMSYATILITTISLSVLEDEQDSKSFDDSPKQGIIFICLNTLMICAYAWQLHSNRSRLKDTDGYKSDADTYDGYVKGYVHGHIETNTQDLIRKHSLTVSTADKSIEGLVKTALSVESEITNKSNINPQGSINTASAQSLQNIMFQTKEEAYKSHSSRRVKK